MTFKKLIDTPALTKMTALLAKNNEMKIYTAHSCTLYDGSLRQFDRSETCKTFQSGSIRISYFDFGGKRSPSILGLQDQSFLPR